MRKFLRLAGEDRRDLMTAACLLAVIRLGLWLLPFRMLLRLVYRQSKDVCSSPIPRPPSATRAAWAIRTASRYVPGTRSCLPRALAAHILLSIRGVPTQLRIGVAPGDTGQLAAHAWVEDQEGVLVGILPDLSRFTPLPLAEGIIR